MVDENPRSREITLPRLFYGTAWKEEATQNLVELALENGFRGIDTANQRRHYHEAAVGQAIANVIAKERLKRVDLFLQSKFTFRRGQDHRLPYDPTASVTEQVKQSFASSLKHLVTDGLDAYLLHGPMHSVGLTKEDWMAWREMEAIYDSGRTRMLGISNVSLGQLQALCEEARIRPSIVQNRCYASQGWDRSVREFCRAKGILYQAFSLLTANREALNSPEITSIAKRYERTVPQIIFRFALEVGMIPLTGTTDSGHMCDDLSVLGDCLDKAEISLIESWASQ